MHKYKFRGALILLMVVLTLFLSSCKKSDYRSHLDFLSAPLSFVSRIEFDGKTYEAEISFQGNDNIRVTLLSPESLKGAVLEYKDGQAYLHYDVISIPIQDGGYSEKNGVLLIRHILSVKEKQFSGADIITESGIKYCVEHYNTESGTVSMYFKKGNTVPEKIKATLNGHTISLTFVNNN